MEVSTILSSHFATNDFDVWKTSIGVVFEVAQPEREEPSPFAANVEAFQLGGMVLTDASLGAQRYVRSSAQARRDGVDHFVLNLYRTGGWRAQTDRGEFVGAAGQVSVLDLSRDLISDEPHSDLVTLFMPRSLLEERLPNLGALHGSAPTGPYAALLGEYIDLLARRLPTLPAGAEEALCRAICEMLVACLQPSLVAAEAARPALELVLLRRAKRFVEAHLKSPSLNVDAICGALGISRRTLYRLFEPEGGVQHHIQARRLEHVRSALVDPSETRRISEIAAEFGFLRTDHFARAFKLRFGRSASEMRDGTLLDTDEKAATSVEAGTTQGFDSWIRALRG